MVDDNIIDNDVIDKFLSAITKSKWTVAVVSRRRNVWVDMIKVLLGAQSITYL